MVEVTFLSVAKIVFGVLFLIPVLHALIMTIMCWIQSRLWWKTNKLFYFIVLLHCSIRSLTMFLPTPVYVKIWSLKAPGIGIQNLLDMTPEITYFLTYVLILLSWMEIYHQSKALRVMPTFNKKASITSIAFIVITVLCFSVMFIMSIVIAVIPELDGGSYDIIIKVQGGIIAAFMVSATIGFIIYFVSLQRMFRRLQKATQANLVSNSTVGRTIFKVTILGLLFLVLLVFRALYILALNAVITDLRNRKIISSLLHEVVWALYFLITELLPFCTILLILFLFDHLPRSRRLRFKRKREKDMCSPTGNVPPTSLLSEEYPPASNPVPDPVLYIPEPEQNQYFPDNPTHPPPYM